MAETMTNRIINSIVIIAMILCITTVSLLLNNTIVLGWYIVPGIMFLVNAVDDDGGREEDKYGV